MNRRPSPDVRRFLHAIAIGALLSESLLACAPLVSSGHRPPADAGPPPVDGSQDGGTLARQPERIDALVAEVHDARLTPALAGAIVDVEGVVAVGVSGVRVAGRAESVTPTDPWHLGSDGKR